MRINTLVIAGLTGVGVLVADQVTKAMVVRELAGGNVVELPLGASLEHGENDGAAFGLLAGTGDFVLVVALIALCCVALLLMAAPARTSGARLGAGLLVGGAAANIVDRAGDGAVTDFVGIGPWPAFNLADIAITLGVALFAVSILFTPDGARRARE